jgi:hypothetical protein
MRRLFGAVIAVLLAVVVPALPADASLPALQLSPLQYTTHLDLGHPKVGYFEAGNPTGSTMHVQVEVEAFRQTDNRGALEYYQDERLAAGIIPGVRTFDLGPHEVIRVKFTIDPNRLGPGGAYGVIFLRTSAGGSAASQINTSERIGTLLILDISGTGTKSGHIQNLSLPAFSYGATTLPVAFHYANTNHDAQGLAFSPDLSLSLGWGAAAQKITGPFVFPGRERPATTKITLADRFGLFPVSLEDSTPGAPKYPAQWVLIVSGYWTWLLPVLICFLIALICLLVLRRSVLHGLRSRLSWPRR